MAWPAVALALLAGARAEPVISEFMAANSRTLVDDDGAYSDWIEIQNPGASAVNLSGWSLSNNLRNPAQWPFPAITIAAGGYLVVYASGKDRRDPTRPLHTSFRLDAGGEYLALVRPEGHSTATEFAPAYPKQKQDVAYGRPIDAAPAGGMNYLQTPTPGAPNSAALPVAPAEIVNFSRPSGPFTGRIELALSGAAPGQTIRYMLVSPSASGAASPPLNASAPAYTTPLTITDSTVVKAAVFAADGTPGELASAHFVRIGPTGAAELLAFSSPLPVLILDNHGAGPLRKDRRDHASWLYRYSSPGTGIPALAHGPEITTPVDVTVRGSSSAGFPKKSYSLDLRDGAGRKQKLPLVGTTAADNWALIAPWYFDPSFIKNSFAYALSNAMGRWAPATQPVEVFFHHSGDLSPADYAGIYVLTETVEVHARKVNLKALSAADVTGGYLLKLDPPDAHEFRWTTARGIPGGAAEIVVASASADELSAEQKHYIQSYVQKMEDTLAYEAERSFATRTYLEYIDRDSWVDFHLLNVFAGNYDAFERSTYFSKDRGGKLVAGPVWDFDRAFGSATYDETMPWDQWSHPTHINFWRTGWWGYLTSDPEFMQDWVDRWQSLRQGLLATSNLVARADELSAAIGPQALARDAARWPLNNPAHVKGVTGGIDSMKAWMVARVGWIDAQFVPPPTVAVTPDAVTFHPPAGAQLAYTLGGADPRSLGGRLAPDARLTAQPLTVAAGTNVHVRSYRADREGIFPGTPWSMAVSAPESTPLRPAARLMNLSARALVGPGDRALIAGIVVSDTPAKNYLLRGVGPTLAMFGATNVLPDPELGLRGPGAEELARNTGWESAGNASTLAGMFRSVGAFPLAPGSSDAAMVATVPAGPHTARLTSQSNQTGVGMLELYATNNAGRTTNLSVRAYVQPGEGSLTGGFVIQGPAAKRLLIRAVGPTLRTLGVTNALADPLLTIYSGQTAVASNDTRASDERRAAVESATAMVGAFALDPGGLDAALLITLPPGAYTAEVRGRQSGAGVAMLEIYDVP